MCFSLYLSDICVSLFFFIATTYLMLSEINDDTTINKNMPKVKVKTVLPLIPKKEKDKEIAIASF